MSDLLASLGLEFVNPNAVTRGLKALKPSDEPQRNFQYSNIPGLEKYCNQISSARFLQSESKEKIRCNGGSCCQKS